ncbi:hypothetical protein SERLA73DRAFT_182208 [Serpula lacrymans var. lacrymans S7.3]|uniref:Uncharacterized protein n=2 Tax=Serpula lacrymans var. lacrymans TaxID=341189 RepID=F8PWU9_SERL3|nr:uncharacterized protein SERLADRAFT_468751 [Serpula lacrymans var. lacrymans S7.9]EGN99276.1 hypothetical protein SERLA73DRAFT_182208 [Serpula lacrymans var. lacrymans S7.3]EGO24841.1 hypothetical protein SERLADRAFT_468751 [Serpula lacrymans var. lacrymans S7.9]
MDDRRTKEGGKLAAGVPVDDTLLPLIDEGVVAFCMTGELPGVNPPESDTLPLTMIGGG